MTTDFNKNLLSGDGKQLIILYTLNKLSKKKKTLFIFYHIFVILSNKI